LADTCGIHFSYIHRLALDANIQNGNFSGQPSEIHPIYFPSTIDLVLSNGAFQSLGYSYLTPGEFLQNYLILLANCSFVGTML